jgi:deazaflavin-dependent oxidoreductase (nitroreductase family)
MAQVSVLRIVSAVVQEEQFLYLTTRGRKTGLPREIEIWFIRIGAAYYLIAEHRTQANWVKNIQHNEQLDFRVGAQQFAGTGRVLDENADAALWQDVAERFAQKYGWNEGLVVELMPDEAAQS